ncbi:hypothetical protein PROFUN_14941 [Planoprotostelium fungivorum]|uniref:Saposin B-type domain-containing protein n=1 Tax=Planoprotostelium fungivorum TaxID=1890364 RepID=A0A2P6MY94_9EUKA|nr:hypothetical protein PROFUN_14941 [Planoprotostelium fungivorum]
MAVCYGRDVRMLLSDKRVDPTVQNSVILNVSWCEETLIELGYILELDRLLPTFILSFTFQVSHPKMVSCACKIVSYDRNVMVTQRLIAGQDRPEHLSLLFSPQLEFGNSSTSKSLSPSQGVPLHRNLIRFQVSFDFSHRPRGERSVVSSVWSRRNRCIKSKPAVLSSSEAPLRTCSILVQRRFEKQTTHPPLLFDSGRMRAELLTLVLLFVLSPALDTELDRQCFSCITLASGSEVNLTRACDKALNYPTAVHTSCYRFISSFGSQVLPLIQQQVSASQVCSGLGVCNAGPTGSQLTRHVDSIPEGGLLISKSSATKTGIYLTSITGMQPTTPINILCGNGNASLDSWRNDTRHNVSQIISICEAGVGLSIWFGQATLNPTTTDFDITITELFASTIYAGQSVIANGYRLLRYTPPSYVFPYDIKEVAAAMSCPNNNCFRIPLTDTIDTSQPSFFFLGYNTNMTAVDHRTPTIAGDGGQFSTIASFLETGAFCAVMASWDVIHTVYAGDLSIWGDLAKSNPWVPAYSQYGRTFKNPTYLSDNLRCYSWKITSSPSMGGTYSVMSSNRTELPSGFTWSTVPRDSTKKTLLKLSDTSKSNAIAVRTIYNGQTKMSLYSPGSTILVERVPLYPKNYSAIEPGRMFLLLLPPLYLNQSVSLIYTVQPGSVVAIPIFNTGNTSAYWWNNPDGEKDTDIKGLYNMNVSTEPTLYVPPELSGSGYYVILGNSMSQARNFTVRFRIAPMWQLDRWNYMDSFFIDTVNTYIPDGYRCISLVSSTFAKNPTKIIQSPVTIESTDPTARDYWLTIGTKLFFCRDGTVGNLFIRAYGGGLSESWWVGNGAVFVKPENITKIEFNSVNYLNSTEWKAGIYQLPPVSYDLNMVRGIDTGGQVKFYPPTSGDSTMRYQSLPSYSIFSDGPQFVGFVPNNSTSNFTIRRWEYPTAACNDVMPCHRGSCQAGRCVCDAGSRGPTCDLPFQVLSSSTLPVRLAREDATLTVSLSGNVSREEFIYKTAHFMEIGIYRMEVKVSFDCTRLTWQVTSITSGKRDQQSHFVVVVQNSDVAPSAFDAVQKYASQTGFSVISVQGNDAMPLPPPDHQTTAVAPSYSYPDATMYNGTEVYTPPTFNPPTSSSSSVNSETGSYPTGGGVIPTGDKPTTSDKPTTGDKPTDGNPTGSATGASPTDDKPTTSDTSSDRETGTLSTDNGGTHTIDQPTDGSSTKTDAQPTDGQDQQGHDGKKRLNPGQIAGIVIGTIAGVALIVVAAVFGYRRYKTYSGYHELRAYN